MRSCLIKAKIFERRVPTEYIVGAQAPTTNGKAKIFVCRVPTIVVVAMIDIDEL